MKAEPQSRFSLFLQLNGGIGLIFVSAGVIMLAVSMVIAARFEERYGAPAETTGTIVTKAKLSTSGNSSNRTGSTSYSVLVDFEIDGQAYLEYSGVDWAYFREVEKGQSVQVFYLPEEPMTFWVSSPPTTAWIFYLRLLGSIGLLFGAYCVWAPWVVAGQRLKSARLGSGWQ